VCSSDLGELVSEGTATTDGQGTFSLSLPARLEDVLESQQLTLDVEVTDVDEQVIASRATVTVHAGTFYVGQRPEGYVARAGQPQEVSLLTLDVHEQPVSNREVQVTVSRREWYTVRERGDNGRMYWTSTYSETEVDRRSATTDEQGRGSITFTPSEGGSYRIQAEAQDDEGHTIRSSVFTWAYGGDVFWGIDNTNRIDLIADKSRYRPGETASILVTAPYEGMTALVTLERAGVVEHRLMTLPDTSELLEVDITADHAPNIYVSVVLVKPTLEELPVPDVRVGIINLPVSTEEQELTIAITPDQEDTAPREDVTYTIRATDHAGNGVRTELSLALVDKAVLALADDPNPTLTQAFYEKRPLGVRTSQTIIGLVDRVTLHLEPGEKGGGGGMAEEVLARRDFPDTAYWNPALVTDDQGNAKVTLTLPDNLTTWRLTARGLTRDTLVGQETSDVVATLPLFVRPSLPRFLTAGDLPTLQAVVHNTTPSAIETDVTLEVAGLHLDTPVQQTVEVPANGQVVVRWQAEVPAPGQTDGQVTLRFSAVGGGLSDAVERVLPVQCFLTPEVVASAGQVRDTPVVETLSFTVPETRTAEPGSSDRPPDLGEMSLELVPSLAAGVESGLDYLEHYPYGCTEQTVSHFLPNAVTYRLFKDLGMEHQDLKTALERNLSEGLQRLYHLQNLDGGWGWWASERSHPYLTAYVVQGLLEVRRAGYGVDQQVFDRALAYLEEVLDGVQPLSPEETGGDGRTVSFDDLSRNTRAYVLFVMSEADRPDRGRTIALSEQREALGIYGRAYLLMTLDNLGQEEERVRTLIGDLMGRAILRTTTAHWEEHETHYWTMSSDDRSTALALQALVRTDPDNFLVPNAVRHLMQRREDGHWRSTQETAVTLMALAEYLAQSGELEASYTYQATLDGQTIEQGSVNRENLDEPVTVVVALAEMIAGQQPAGDQQHTSSLTLQKEGPGRLHYSLRLRSYQDASEVEPLDRGMAVQRDYISVDQDTLEPTGALISEAQASEVVQVRVTLTVPDHVSYLVVEDMLPAGLEPLDTSLKTVSDAVQEGELAEEGEEEDEDEVFPSWRYFAQTEIHDNRVALFATYLTAGTYHYTYLARATTAGTFQTLPTLAYQMYAPEVFGRSSGTRFVVR
jgi:alpha-2-macroglobulin